MASEISIITMLGAGTMGRGIAHVAAVAGYKTRLYDTAEGALQNAQGTIRRNLAKGVELKKVDPAVAEGALGRLSLCTNLSEAVEDTGLVIEAVPEDMALKIESFHAVAIHAPEHALFAS